MRNGIRSSLFALLTLLSATAAMAQNPVKWSFSTKDAGNCQVDLIMTGTIDEGWYTYSQFLESEDGPVATALTFQQQPHFKLLGKAKEGGEIIKVHDKVFDMNLTKFKHKAVITQRVEVTDPSKPITGYITFMTCNDEMCLPPKDVDFTFKPGTLANCGTAPAKPDPKAPGTTPAAGNGDQGAVSPTPAAPGDAATETAAATPENPDGNAPDDPNFKGFFHSKRPEINAAKFVGACGEITEGSGDGASLVSLFLFCFLGGLIALLTPCVFPMVPMTVSFFVKRSKSRQAGLRNAFIYAASIILIFLALGTAVTSALGPTALNDMSTNKWFNLGVFVLLVVFAFSFFGFYEITLPSSWVNKSDRMADRGGLIGTFFMAFTLVLVSFSCTGPIVGTLLGAIILGSLRNGLTLLNVQAFYQLFATGLIILAAMLIDRATRGRE